LVLIIGGLRETQYSNVLRGNIEDFGERIEACGFRWLGIEAEEEFLLLIYGVQNRRAFLLARKPLISAICLEDVFRSPAPSSAGSINLGFWAYILGERAKTHKEREKA
jgi:hypothetical protein